MATPIAEPNNKLGNETLLRDLNTTVSTHRKRPATVTKERVSYGATSTDRVEISKPASAVKVGFLVNAVRWLVALDNWLSGDPMTDQERTQANIFRAQHDCRHYASSNWRGPWNGVM